jgi:hypothetical protein
MLSLLIGSCTKNSNCYECYLDHFTHEQAKYIVELNGFFENYLQANYSQFSGNDERLRRYCLDIMNEDFKEQIDEDARKKLIYDYNQYALNEAFRDWNTGKYDIYNGLHFRALKNCLNYDLSDSLLFKYIQAYEFAGDLPPGGFILYITDFAESETLNSRILRHLFVMEYFIPRMMKD